MCNCNCEFTYFNRPSRLDPKDSCHCVSNNPFNRRHRRRKHRKHGHGAKHKCKHCHDHRAEQKHHRHEGHSRDCYQPDAYDNYYGYRPRHRDVKDCQGVCRNSHPNHYPENDGYRRDKYTESHGHNHHDRDRHNHIPNDGYKNGYHGFDNQGYGFDADF